MTITSEVASSLLPPPFGVPGVPADDPAADDDTAPGTAVEAAVPGVSIPEAEESPVQTIALQFRPPSEESVRVEPS